VLSLRRGIGVFDVARNMGTSVQFLQNYYGKHATPRKLATQLGGQLDNLKEPQIGSVGKDCQCRALMILRQSASNTSRSLWLHDAGSKADFRVVSIGAIMSSPPILGLNSNRALPHHGSD
jgi:hypothetical protein